VEPAPPGPPSTPGTPPPPDLSPPPGITTEALAAQAGYSAATIAKWLAAGYIVKSILSPPTPSIPTPAPLGPTNFGTGGQVNLPGLNPGYMVNPPRYYNMPGSVAAQYYYGPRSPQPGPTFDPVLYNTLPVAPPPAFGLTTMYDPGTQTIPTLLAGVQRAAATGPVAPRV
jgi:hypothetical protein